MRYKLDSTENLRSFEKYSTPPEVLVLQIKPNIESLFFQESSASTISLAPTFQDDKCFDIVRGAAAKNYNRNRSYNRRQRLHR